MDRLDAERRARRTSEAWMLSVEGVTRAPIDLGVQLGLELPVGLRISAGYGWVPAPYLDLVTQLTSLGSQAAALLGHAFQTGRTWRLQGGFRPFHELGFYLDGGYSELRLAGSLDASAAPGVSLSGTYNADATIGVWLVELGYEAWLGQHVVLGIAGGMIGVVSSHSRLSGPGITSSDAAQAAATFDAQVIRYGKVPTLTARFGFDFI